MTKARGFWEDLMGTIWNDPKRSYSSAVVSTEFIADRMNLSVDETEKFMIMCNKAGLTDRQGGGWVV